MFLSPFVFYYNIIITIYIQEQLFEVEARANARFQDRRASGKGWNAHVGIHGKIAGQELGGEIGGGMTY